MKQQTGGQLCVEHKSKIWCKNIHTFLRNCNFHVGAFYFDAPCSAADDPVQVVHSNTHVPLFTKHYKLVLVQARN